MINSMNSTTDTTQTNGLTERQERILALELNWWKYAGVKETRVRADFGVSMTKYYAELNALIDLPAALAHDPLLVNRLRRMRTSRRVARSAARLRAER